VQDTTVIRWPQYAAEPTIREHVTEEGSKVSSLVHKLKHSGIDSSMVQSARGDMTPGTSVLILLTPETAVDAFAKAFEGQGVELIRSDLSVQEQDEVRAALDDSNAADQSQPPGICRRASTDGQRIRAPATATEAPSRYCVLSGLTQ
jgi:hypothetical protein